MIHSPQSQQRGIIADCTMHPDDVVIEACRQMIDGETYAITDIGMRMLTPREQFRAQGFPDSYVIDRGHDGRPMTKTEQTRMCGNSVCPPLARALVEANCSKLAVHIHEGEAA